tara:strand:+ start:1214 stop:1675 length:462 start_codon:yes stop_codon:yes gene_type:complete
MVERGINDYAIVNSIITRPLGLSEWQRTLFEINPVYGDWSLDDKIYDLYLHDLLPVLNDKTGFHYVKLNDIAWKGFDLDMSVRGENCICCDGDRFRDCDSTKPGILLEGIKNPGGRKYRCLDGKHRIEVLLSYGQEYGNFYILNVDHIRHYLN